VSTDVNTINIRVSSFLLSKNHRNACIKVGYMTIIKKMTIMSTRLEPTPWTALGNVLSLQQIMQMHTVGP
jgi:hypothetical protein